MSITIYSSVDKIPQNQWNQLAKTPYQLWGWFKAHEAYFKETRFTYLVMHENGSLKTILPLYDNPSPHYASPQLLTFGRFQTLANHKKFLIVGSPLAFESQAIGDEKHTALLTLRAKDLLKEKKYDYLIFPFMRDKKGLDGFYSKPSMVDYDLLDLKEGFEGYLKQFKTKHRTIMRKEVKLCQDYQFFESGLEGRERLFADLRHLTAQRNRNDAYLHPEFYTELIKYMGKDIRVLWAKKDEHIHAAQVFFNKDNTYYMFHVGSQDKPFVYFNLAYYQPIQMAMNEGIGKINYRPSSDKAKRIRKCLPQQLYLWITPNGGAATCLLNAYRLLGIPYWFIKALWSAIINTGKK